MRRTSGERDRAWLEQLFDQHSRHLRAFAVRRVGADAADDVVSEVFATAWRRRDDVPEPALAWLFQTARHAVLHHVRAGDVQRAADRQTCKVVNGEVECD